MCDKLCLEGVKSKPGRSGGVDQWDEAMWGREHSFQMAWVVTELMLRAALNRAPVSCSQGPYALT